MKKRDSWKTNWVVGLLVFVFIGVIALWLAINNDMVMMGPDEDGNSVRGECGMILEGSELVMDDRTVGGGRIERDIPGNKFSLDKIKKRNLEMAEVISKPKVEIKSRGEKAKHNLDEKSVVMADDVTVSYDLAEKYVRDILFEKGLERKSDKNDLKEQAFEIIEETKSATGIEKENLVEKKAIKVKSLELISFSQNYKGVPVYLGDVKALKSGDKWVKINSNYYNEIDLYVNPLLSREQAIEKARQQLCIIGEPLDEPSLVVYPFISKQGKKYYLTYKVELPLHEYSNGQLLRPSVFVDAKTGGIIDVIDNIREETASGRITGDIIPDYYGQARETRNFSNEYLISGDYESTSDNLGGYNFDIGSNSQLQTKLEGSWVRLVNDIQEESQANLNLPPYQNDIDWVQYDNSYQK